MERATRRRHTLGPSAYLTTVDHTVWVEAGGGTGRGIRAGEGHRVGRVDLMGGAGDVNP